MAGLDDYSPSNNGPNANREEEKKMTKQLTPAEIEFVQQSSRYVLVRTTAIEPIMGDDGFLVGTRPQIKTTGTEPIVGDDGFLVGVQ
jgi:hypothetical protein